MYILIQYVDLIMNYVAVVAWTQVLSWIDPV